MGNQPQKFSTSKINLGGTKFGFTSSGGGAPPVNPWTQRNPIVIDHTKVANTDQINFPIVFTGTFIGAGDDPDLRSVGNGGTITDPNGYDMGFYQDAAGTSRYKWELVYWDPVTGFVEFHVLLPVLSTSVDTTIYFASGNSSITTDQSQPTMVWDGNFKGVYHLSNGSVLTALDSTSNANDGTIAAGGPAAAAGQIDGGAEAAAATNSNINLGSGASLNIVGQITLSCWVNLSNVGILQNLICKGSEDYRLRLNGTSIDCGSYDGADHQVSYASPITTGVWVYLSGAYDGTNWRLRYNGVNVASQADATGAIAGVADTRLMSSTAGTQRFMEGIMDEARISDVLRSDDWEATTYNNQVSPSTFYSVGAPL